MTSDQVAGPVMKELMENVLPYLGIEQKYNEKELKMEETRQIIVPKLIGLDVKDAKEILQDEEIKFEIIGEGEKIIKQFPQQDEAINYDEKIILYTH